MNADFCRLYAQLKSAHSMEHATTFALTVASAVLESQQQQGMMGMMMGGQGEEEEGNAPIIDREYLCGAYISAVEQQLANAAEAESNNGGWLSGLGGLGGMGGMGGGAAPSAKQLDAARASAMEEITLLFPFSTSPDDDASSSSSSAVAAASSKNQLPLHWDFVSNSSAYLAARNLPVNSYSLNGIVVSSGDASGQGSMGNTLMQVLSVEQHHVTHLYRTKVITDKTKSLFAAILSSADACYARFHPMLEEAAPEYVDFSATAAGRELIQSVSFVNPSFTTPQEEVSVASSTILHVPATPAGYAAAATALQWSIASASSGGADQATAVAGGRSAGGGDETAPPAPKESLGPQRVGIVLYSPSTASSTATSAAAEQCSSAEAAASEQCTAASATVAADENDSAEELAVFLARLQDALSEPTGGDADSAAAGHSNKHCGLHCATTLHEVRAGSNCIIYICPNGHLCHYCFSPPLCCGSSQ